VFLNITVSPAFTVTSEGENPDEVILMVTVLGVGVGFGVGVTAGLGAGVTAGVGFGVGVTAGDGVGLTLVWLVFDLLQAAATKVRATARMIIFDFIKIPFY
jgi:hypothetical protein